MSEFPKGIFVKEPHQKAPDFVKGKILIKVDDAVAYLQGLPSDKEWINLDIKVSKTNKWYCAINEFKPEQAEHIEERKLPQQPYKTQDDGEDDLPF